MYHQLRIHRIDDGWMNPFMRREDSSLIGRSRRGFGQDRRKSVLEGPGAFLFLQCCSLCWRMSQCYHTCARAAGSTKHQHSTVHRTTRGNRERLNELGLFDEARNNLRTRPVVSATENYIA
eukprot:GHVU01102861.1.p1 GENE.GHVU01102861.1~~GHVU01102861.1.p1  ORF type:complete len:121 (+),score=5.78 GHVU01102861.1:366-728(+)